MRLLYTFLKKINYGGHLVQAVSPYVSASLITISQEAMKKISSDFEIGLCCRHANDIESGPIQPNVASSIVENNFFFSSFPPLS